MIFGKPIKIFLSVADLLIVKNAILQTKRRGVYVRRNYCKKLFTDIGWA